MSGVWLKPLATRHALKRSMMPSGLCLILNTYLHPLMLPWDGGGTKVHATFFIKAAYSVCIARLQFWSLRACVYVYGSIYEIARKTFFLMIPVLDRVSIGWQLVGLMTMELGALVSENGTWILGRRVSIDEFGEVGGGEWVVRVEMDGSSVRVGDDTWGNVERSGAGIARVRIDASWGEDEEVDKGLENGNTNSSKITWQVM